MVHGQGHVTTSTILHPMKYLKVQSSNFVHGLATRTNFYMTNCPRNGRGWGHVTVLNFGQISVNISKRYKIETYFQWKTNRKSYMAYRMTPVLVTLNDLEGHFPRSFSLCKCNPSHICATFYQISTDSVTWPTVPKMGVVKVTWLS